MTSEEYDKLTDTEKRIKVAELDDWERGPKEPITFGCFGKVIPMSCWHQKTLESNWQDNPPDYLNDLNACHEFENTMIDIAQLDEYEYAQLDEYEYALKDVCNDNDVWHATAEQRCKAFVLTMTGNE